MIDHWGSLEIEKSENFCLQIVLAHCSSSKDDRTMSSDHFKFVRIDDFNGQRIFFSKKKSWKSCPIGRIVVVKMQRTTN